MTERARTSAENMILEARLAKSWSQLELGKMLG